MNQALTLVGVSFSFVLACVSARAIGVDRQPYILEIDVPTMPMPLRIQEYCYMSVLSLLSGKEAEHLCAYKHARFECSAHHAPAREDTWDGSARASLPRYIRPHNISTLEFLRIHGQQRLAGVQVQLELDSSFTVAH